MRTRCTSLASLLSFSCAFPPPLPPLSSPPPSVLSGFLESDHTPDVNASSSAVKMSSDGVKAMLKENVGKMNQVEGFDVVVVCTNNDPQASYWQNRLEAAK